jgi:hypothetical protein
MYLFIYIEYLHFERLRNKKKTARKWIKRYVKILTGRQGKCENSSGVFRFCWITDCGIFGNLYFIEQIRIVKLLFCSCVCGVLGALKLLFLPPKFIYCMEKLL